MNDPYYCTDFGLNFAAYNDTYSNERTRGIARIGVFMDSSYPCGGYLSTMEGVGLMSRNGLRTDNVLPDYLGSG